MNAAPLITSGTGQYKVVCHKCQYMGFEPNSTQCPTCGFPLLLEPHGSDGLTLRDIFDRSTIEVKGRSEPALLPGVTRSARQRKQMLERVQKRLGTTHERQTEPRLIDRTSPVERCAPVHGTIVTATPPPPSHPSWTPAPLAMAALAPILPDEPAPHAAPRSMAVAATVRSRSYRPMFLAFLLFFATTAMAAASSGF